jgi:mannan endo-1,4-beta-mannosidase
MGGINTISWLVHDPANPKENAHSKSDTTVKSIFSNPKTLYQYKFWLDKLASYLGNLKGPKGEPIPVVLRLFHEHTGHWYWWAANRCTPEEFKKLFRFTVFYLRDTKHIHNVLYAYCSDHFNTQTEYLERYPGDDVIDIIGVDMYDHPKYNFVTEGQNMVSLIKTIGIAKNKPYAIMETGLIDKSEDNWWTNSLSPVVKNSGLSYVLTWANAPKVIFSPYVGKINTDDFKIFATNGLLFLKDIKSHSVYK